MTQWLKYHVWITQIWCATSKTSDFFFLKMCKWQLLILSRRGLLLCFGWHYEALNDISWIFAMRSIYINCRLVKFCSWTPCRVVSSKSSGSVSLAWVAQGGSGTLMDLLTKDTKGPQGWSKIQAHLLSKVKDTYCSRTPRWIKDISKLSVWRHCKIDPKGGRKVTSQHIVFTAFG